MHTPDLIARALRALRARLSSSLGVAVLVAVVGVAVSYGITVDPSLLPEDQQPEVAGQPPYRTYANARAAIEEGKARAAASGKLLMVMFGANWCPDCITLHRNLMLAPETRSYAEKHFEIVEIDVGDSKKNAAVQRALGFKIDVIPLAIFYSSTGELIGHTFAGELKPARHFTARDVRDFLREVVDHRRIVTPTEHQ